MRDDCRARAAGLVAAALLLAAAACSESESPAALLRAVDSVDGLRDEAAREELLLEESFDHDVPEGWVPQGDASLVRIRNGALEIGARGGESRPLPHLHKRIAVQPETSYRVRASVRTDALEPRGRDTAGASLEILEWDASGRGPLAYHAHLPRERGSSVEWRSLDYLLQTTPETRALTLALVPAHGRASGTAFFDDISLARQSAAAEARNAPPYTSLIRPEAREGVKSVTVGGDTRPAIVTAIGSTWEWDPGTGGPSGLRFAIAAVGEEEAQSEVCFTVRQQTRALFESCVAAGAAGEERWREEVVSLTAGGALRFETRWSPGADPSDALAVWGNPRVARSEPASSRPPNIVLVVFDTLRADHVGAEGYTLRPTTPNVDRVARESVRYARAFAPSAWTTPTLGSLITSRYPAQHGAGLRIPREIELSDVVTPPGRRAHGHTGLAPAEVTLGQLLATAGYETVGFHRNLLFGAALGFARGFDRYEYYPGEDLAGGAEGAERVRRWLRGRREEGNETPFFLVFHLMDPHLPYRMRSEQYEQFGPPLLPHGHDLDPAQPFVAFHDWTRQPVETEEELARVIAMYDSEIAYADRAFGMVIDALDPALERTVVAVTSDHGEGFGEHGHFEHGNSMYSELIRVPLYLRLPRAVEAGRVVEEPVSLLDVAPTLLGLAGLAPLPGMEGVVLPGVPSLGRIERPRRGLLAEASFLGPDQTALLRDGHKYVLTHPRGYLGFQDGDPASRRRGAVRGAIEELYRLEDDPREGRDLAAAETERVAEMRAAVWSWLQERSRGLHLRCGGAPSASTALTLRTTATIGEIKPMSLERDDLVSIAASRRRVDFLLNRSGATPSDWLIVRLLDPEAEVVVTARDQPDCRIDLYAADGPAGRGEITVRTGDGSLEGRSPAEPEGSSCWCRLWEVPWPGGSSPSLGEQALQELRALGYVR